MCVFCDIISYKIPADIVVSTPSWVSFLDVKPVRKGHVLIVPRYHIEHLGDLNHSQFTPMMDGVQGMMKAVMTAMKADGAFIATNTIVSQSVPHLHFHVIPRNFKDGLRGFFWPRIGYDSDDERKQVAKDIQQAYYGLGESIEATVSNIDLEEKK
jgi:histidine triad (HIT) family protein